MKDFYANFYDPFNRVIVPTVCLTPDTDMKRNFYLTSAFKRPIRPTSHEAYSPVWQNIRLMTQGAFHVTGTINVFITHFYLSLLLLPLLIIQLHCHD